MDESVVQCHGRMEYLGDRERRAETNYRVHRECNHDGPVFSNSGVDVRREDWKQLEEDTVAKREDSVWLFFDNRDAAVTSAARDVSAI